MRRFQRSLVFTIILSCGLMASAQKTEVVVNKTGGSNYPNEPSVAISRTNPNQVVVCANINNHYTSNDFGKTWEEGNLQSDYGFYGDPVLHATPNGVIHLTHLSYVVNSKKDKKHYRFLDRIVTQYSTDGGITFSSGNYAGFNGDKVQDKPWLSSDDRPNGTGNIYLTWTQFDRYGSKKKKHKSRIYFSSSTATEQKWSPMTEISDTVGNCVDSDHTLEGATTALDPEGVLYCVWAGHHKLYFDKSDDQGQTWNKDKIIANQYAGWDTEIPNVYRTNGMPFLICDNSEGPHRGRLYVVYGDVIEGNADVFIIHSDDQGESWSKPMQVHSESPKAQYMPNIAIDPITGNLIVIYYDRRHSNTEMFSDIYGALSTDGGETFTERKLNQYLTNPYGKKTFSGDYIDIDFFDSRMAIVWGAKLDNTQQIHSLTATLADFFNLPNFWIPGQIAFAINSEDKKEKIYFRVNETSTLEYTYYHKNWLGSVRQGSITVNIPIEQEGTTNDFVFDKIVPRKFKTSMVVKTGDRQIFKRTTLGK